jgi:hypothetical protein
VKTWKIILAASIIFGTGLVSGFLIAGQLQNRSRGPHPIMAQRMELLRRMERPLDLTPAQQKRIGEILRASQERMGKLWDQIRPQAQDEFRVARELIRAELTPEQRKKFEHLLREHRGPRRLDEPFSQERRRRGEEGPSRPSHKRPQSQD